MAGSVAMLLSFLAIYLATGTFDFMDLAAMGRSGELARQLDSTFAGRNWLGIQHASLVIFAGVFLGFAVKVPLVPFHTWLPAAYTEAPTGTTMMLTGLMSKMGVYGFLRVLLPLFPGRCGWCCTRCCGWPWPRSSFRRRAAFAQTRPETHLRLFLHQPPGLLPAGHFRGGARRPWRRQGRRAGRGAERRASCRCSTTA